MIWTPELCQQLVDAKPWNSTIYLANDSYIQLPSHGMSFYENDTNLPTARKPFEDLTETTQKHGKTRFVKWNWYLQQDG